MQPKLLEVTNTVLGSLDVLVNFSLLLVNLAAAYKLFTDLNWRLKTSTVLKSTASHLSTVRTV